MTGGEAFVASLKEQSRDWARLRAEFPEAGFVVAGDFNQDLAESHYYGSSVGRGRLRKTLEAHGLVCLTAGESDPLAKHGRASIDHICVSGHLQAADVGAWPAGSLQRSLTDHYGVWVDL